MTIENIINSEVIRILGYVAGVLNLMWVWWFKTVWVWEIEKPELAIKARERLKRAFIRLFSVSLNLLFFTVVLVFPTISRVVYEDSLRDVLIGPFNIFLNIGGYLFYQSFLLNGGDGFKSFFKSMFDLRHEGAIASFMLGRKKEDIRAKMLNWVGSFIVVFSSSLMMVTWKGNEPLLVYLIFSILSLLALNWTVKFLLVIIAETDMKN